MLRLAFLRSVVEVRPSEDFNRELRARQSAFLLAGHYALASGEFHPLRSKESKKSAAERAERLRLALRNGCGKLRAAAACDSCRGLTAIDFHVYRFRCMVWILATGYCFPWRQKERNWMSYSIEPLIHTSYRGLDVAVYRGVRLVQSSFPIRQTKPREFCGAFFILDDPSLRYGKSGIKARGSGTYIHLGGC